MNSSREELLFAAAAGFDDPAQQRAFLDAVCVGDPALRARLEALLGSRRSVDAFFGFDPRGSGAGGSATGEGVGTTLGRYRLLKRIGDGGHGAVYRAEQETPVRRKVALKIIKLGLDTEAVIARFEIERQALAQMDHPNIARVLDAGATATGRPYFVMELVEGRKITDFCDGRRLGLRERLGLFVQVCRAIHHAHQKGVIHRDIKPSNVLVDAGGEAPTPKVIDFGIAKAATFRSACPTQGDQCLGTPGAMSPEQAHGGMDIDTRSDVYSLGVLLYELLAGVPPFDAARLAGVPRDEALRIVREEDPPAPSTAGRGLPAGERDRICAARGCTAEELECELRGDLDCIVMKAMEKERARRYDSAMGLAMDVERHLRDEVVLARPASRLYRTQKLVRRNRLVFATGAILLAGLLGCLSVSTVMYFRERAARKEQVRLREQAEHRERITRAAVRLKYRNTTAADALAEEIPVAQTPSSTEAVQVFGELARWHLQAGRVREAAARFASQARAVSSADLSDRPDVSFEVLPGAAVVAYAGDAAGYDNLRRFLLARFGATENPQVAEQTLKACLLMPADREVLAALRKPGDLVARAVERAEGVFGRRPSNAAWGCFALALKDYRAGELQQARRWIERCLSSPDPYPPRVAGARAVMAMIAQRSGAHGEAVAALEPAKVAVREALAAQAEGGEWPVSWFDWITAATLLAEAERLVAVDPR